MDKVVLVWLMTLITCLPLDLAIALQAWLVVLLFRKVSRTKSPHWVASIATILFFLVHAYLWFDFLLYRDTGLRMQFEFFGFLAAADSFTSSVSSFGTSVAVAGVVVLLIAQGLVYRLFLKGSDEFQFSSVGTIMFVVLTALGLYCRSAAPTFTMADYMFGNAAARSQILYAEHWVGRDSLASMDADVDQAVNFLTPVAENFEKVNSDYPFLKDTRGFVGARQFDLHLEADERPHVVFLFMESFRAADIGVLGGRHGASPNFDRLSREGILFSNFYANGVQTTRAVMAAMFGILPCYTIKSVQSGNPNIPAIGIADILAEHGYRTGFINGGSLRFERKDLFFPQHGYHELHGMDEIANSMSNARGTSWGVHDEYLMKYLVDWIEKKDQAGQPSFSAAFTVSHHHPFRAPPGYRAPNFQQAENDTYANYLQTFHYSDHCLGLFMSMLEQRGLADNTIVFVLADTASSGGVDKDATILLGEPTDREMRIPLLILAPGRISEPKLVEDVGSQVDLFPTLMDILGLRGRNHSIGTTLLRKVDGRTAYFSNPFQLGYIGIRRGPYSYIYCLGTTESKLTDLPSNAVLNIDDPRVAEITEQLRSESLSVQHLFLRMYAAEKICPAQK